MSKEGIQAVFARRDYDVHVVSARWGDDVTGIIAASVMRASEDRGLISIRKESLTHHFIEKGGAFAISLLGHDQLDYVKRFAFFSGEATEKFQGVPHEFKVTGCPILSEAVGYLDCRVVGSLDAGDYTVFMGEVMDGELLKDREPLRGQHLYASPEFQQWLREWRDDAPSE